MTAVQSADPDSEREVVRSLIPAEYKVFDRHATVLELVRCELGCRSRNCLCNSLGGTVDSKDVAIADALEHGACGDAGTAANLQHAHARAQRQCFDDFSEAWQVS
jgi:hypothetical protein